MSPTSWALAVFDCLCAGCRHCIVLLLGHQSRFVKERRIPSGRTRRKAGGGGERGSSETQRRKLCRLGMAPAFHRTAGRTTRGPSERALKCRCSLAVGFCRSPAGRRSRHAKSSSRLYSRIGGMCVRGVVPATPEGELERDGRNCTQGDDVRGPPSPLRARLHPRHVPLVM